MCSVREKDAPPRGDAAADAPSGGKKAEVRETAGSEFVKKIGFVGCAMFLMMLVLYLIICFKPNSSPLEGYAPPQTPEYYAQHLDELKTELEENVFPILGGAISCVVDGGVLELAIPEEQFWDVRSAILEHFDAELFEFTKSTE